MVDVRGLRAGRTRLGWLVFAVAVHRVQRLSRRGPGPEPDPAPRGCGGRPRWKLVVAHAGGGRRQLSWRISHLPPLRWQCATGLPADRARRSLLSDLGPAGRRPSVRAPLPVGLGHATRPVLGRGRKRGLPTQRIPRGGHDPRLQSGSRAVLLYLLPGHELRQRGLLQRSVCAEHLRRLCEQGHALRERSGVLLGEPLCSGPALRDSEGRVDLPRDPHAHQHAGAKRRHHVVLGRRRAAARTDRDALARRPESAAQQGLAAALHCRWGRRPVQQGVVRRCRGEHRAHRLRRVARDGDGDGDGDGDTGDGDGDGDAGDGDGSGSGDGDGDGDGDGPGEDAGGESGSNADGSGGDDASGGCGCRTADASPGLGLLVLGLLPALRRRRRGS